MYKGIYHTRNEISQRTYAPYEISFIVLMGQSCSDLGQTDVCKYGRYCSQYSVGLSIFIFDLILIFLFNRLVFSFIS
eukprot:UN25295